MSPAPSPLSARRVEPELLDDLPTDDPRAMRSRSDLRRVNVLMGQRGIMTDLLRRHIAAPPRRILEIGSGDGAFMLGLAKRLSGAWPGVEIVLLDRQDLVAPDTLEGFRRLGWRPQVVTSDVFEWLGGGAAEPFDAIAANLFLHHFDDRTLARLLAGLGPLAPVFVATEPRRAEFALALSRMLGLVGANDVTRHDAPASVRAGFAGGEIGALWPSGRGDRIEEGPRGLFTHGFAAVATGARL